jgi:hypothetical protein
MAETRPVTPAVDGGVLKAHLETVLADLCRTLDDAEQGYVTGLTEPIFHGRSTEYVQGRLEGRMDAYRELLVRVAYGRLA